MQHPAGPHTNISFKSKSYCCSVTFVNHLIHLLFVVICLNKCYEFTRDFLITHCGSADSNPGIRELPVELGQLSNLWQLDIEDLNITNVPEDVRKEGTVEIISKSF